jgi:hypothetical protein
MLFGQPSSGSEVPPPNGGYYIDPTTHLVTEAPPTPPGQPVPSGAQACDTDDISELQPDSACYAAALREEQQDTDSENYQITARALSQLNKPEFAGYGTMLCENSGDVVGMRSQTSFGSCKASHGGWGTFVAFDATVASFFVKLESGETGWTVNADDFEDCEAFKVSEHYDPNAQPDPHCN